MRALPVKSRNRLLFDLLAEAGATGIVIPGANGEIEGSIADRTVILKYLKNKSWAVEAVRLMQAVVAAQGPGSWIDLGANIGTTAIPAALAGVRCHAVEPEPANLALLRRNIERNGIAGRVTVHEAAAWHEAAELEFEIAPANLGDHRVRTGAPDSDSAYGEAARETIAVPARPVDTLIDAGSLAGPVLVKVDVQGAEGHALAGGAALFGRADIALLGILALRPAPARHRSGNAVRRGGPALRLRRPAGGRPGAGNRAACAARRTGRRNDRRRRGKPHRRPRSGAEQTRRRRFGAVDPATAAGPPSPQGKRAGKGELHEKDAATCHYAGCTCPDERPRSGGAGYARPGRCRRGGPEPDRPGSNPRARAVGPSPSPPAAPGALAAPALGRSLLGIFLPLYRRETVAAGALAEPSPSPLPRTSPSGAPASPCRLPWRVHRRSAVALSATAHLVENSVRLSFFSAPAAPAG